MEEEITGAPDNSSGQGGVRMAELQVCLLGSFQVCWDFAPVPPGVWRNRHAVRLLKLALVMRPEPVSVADAARLLGPGLTPGDVAAAAEQASRVLHPAAVLRVAEAKVEFLPQGPCWIDRDALLAHYRAGVQAAARGDMFPAILAFQEADALYQGDLLEEIQEPWVLAPRRQLQELYTEILERLAEGHAVLARYQDAVGFCHKALAHDPLRESTYQRMMVYYYYLGDMVGAAEAYAACREALEGAGRRVSGETAELWKRLTNRELAAGAAADVAAALHSDGDPHGSDDL
jgi:DNA-binding SARP family transcriptional activator